MDILLIPVIIIQNISLLRAIRLGPFSAIDLLITYIVAKYAARNNYEETIAAFILLICMGEGIHYLLGIETPVISGTIFAHRAFYNWLGLTPLC